MPQYPLISVIIPAYNAEKTIVRACRSVLAQTYPNVELIVVNDGSADGTGALLEELAAQHGSVHVLHQENRGVCAARNAGIEASKGQRVCFLDADDELTERALQSLFETMEATQGDIAAGCCVHILPDGTSRGNAYPLPGDVWTWHGLEPLKHSLEDFPATYSVWGKLYRREVIGDVRFVEGRRIHEDSFFLFQLFQKKLTMAVTNDVTVRYYLTENSASRAAFSEKFLDILYFAQEKRDIIEKNHPQYLDLAKNVEIKACLSLLNKMRLGCPKEYKAVQKQCMATVRKNARFFIPVLPIDRITFTAVRLRLFWLYQWVYRLVKG